MDSLDRHWRQREYEHIATEDARGGGPSRRRRGGTGFGLLTLVALVVVGLVFYGFWDSPPDQSAALVRTCVEFRLSGGDEVPPPTTMRRARAVIEERIAATGVVKPEVTVRAPDRLLFELSGIVAEADALDKVIGLLAATGVLEVVPVPIETSARGSLGDALRASLADSVPLYDHGAVTDAWVDTDEVENASADEDEAAVESTVHLLVDESTTVVVREHVHDHFGESLAVMLDDTVVATSKIRSTFFEGEALVSASFTPQEADAFAAVLRSGVLPLDVAEINTWPCDDASREEDSAEG